MEATQSPVEQAQQELDDARSDQTGVRQEREHFEQQEKDALVQIDNEYSGITKATEVFEWFVRDDDVAPAWSGVELRKQDGNTTRQDGSWKQTMSDLLVHRGGDHVRAVLNVADNAALGQLPSSLEAAAATRQPTDARKVSNSPSQTCYDAKLKDFRRDIGELRPLATT
ncbi:hypothetical protein MJS38_34470, partial [Burkholderia gladioli]